MRTWWRLFRTKHALGSTGRAVLVLLPAVALLLGAAPRWAAAANVLRVGTYKGKVGDFTTIQDAVDAAQPGDWVLIAPGDYHERGDYTHPGPDGEAGAGVLIRTPNIHIRGLDRNLVVIDGTKPGSAQCDSSTAAQDLGPLDTNSNPMGRNGIEVFEVDGVSIENLTACNFLTGSAGGGNQIWFNGGDGSGTVNMGTFSGAYLSATSTIFLGNDAPGGEYGIFVSNARGPGVIQHTYASNMRDASYYVGACADCNTTLTDAHAENSALGYSGTNSGGHLIVEKSEWDENTTGISTNSQNNDDAPSPQDGACPNNGTGPTGSHSCTVFRNNFIHDNNNPNVPRSGSAGLGPVGTGMIIAGGRNDTIMGNKIVNQGSWGILVVPFPDSTDTAPPVAHCEGGADHNGFSCYYDSWGHEITKNTFKYLKGFVPFGNVSNGDLAEISDPHDPGSCWHKNKHTGGVTTSPADLQTTHAQCGVSNSGADLASDLAAQVICATEVFGPCPDQPGMHYPRTTVVAMKSLPPQKKMPSVCKGVPKNPWC
jgi:hypothetical protein